MKARIRDFIRTVNGWIFAVADYHHPKGIRCMLRYVPDPNGDREENGIKYRKLDFDQAFDFLRKVKPDYIQDLHVVPERDVLKLYQPEVMLPQVAQKNPKLNKIVSILEDGGVPQESMGITGSMLIGLNGPTSDIDFVVYGDHWWTARDLISEAKDDGRIQDLNEETWKKIYSKRVPDISYEEFVAHEERKGNRGLVDGTYFDLLFTREWDQIAAPTPPGKKVEIRQISAEVTEADFAFDNPSILKLDHPDVEEIHCFTHTYAGQALPGEIIEARGMIEDTGDGLIMVVGTSREAKGEWIRSLTLLKKASPRL